MPITTSDPAGVLSAVTVEKTTFLGKLFDGMSSPWDATVGLTHAEAQYAAVGYFLLGAALEPLFGVKLPGLGR